MPKLTHRLSALCMATVLAVSSFATASPVEFVAAADAPWVTPTVPAKCTTQQIDSGNVAGCIVALGPGLPETRGWPAPPYPSPDLAGGTVLAWVDLTIGSTGPTVVKVQQALIDFGATIAADGQFGPITAAAVTTFQADRGLPATGVVDQVTATSLGVQNTGTGVFPPAGWTWLGWGYNGSTALFEWEQQLARNGSQIGSVKSGQLRSFADSLPLFEGFVAEIQTKGYVIGDAGMYVFRCTASTRKDCAGLTRSSLSNHAYGLALDFNTAKNPLKTYYGVNGASACQTPMLTDVPQWVVQVAEKWGLYWGGYGWSSGCSSPSQVKSSASRDPMHFEFNGTVAQARAILAFNTAGSSSSPVVAPPGAVTAPAPSGGKCFLVADTKGAITTRCYGKTEVPGANTRVVVATGAPAGTTAALVNITTTGAADNGYITADACATLIPGPQTRSVVNFAKGDTVANFAVVPSAPSPQGSEFCTYSPNSVHEIIDVQGFFGPPTASSLSFTLQTPSRIVDTRGCWTDPATQAQRCNQRNGAGNIVRMRAPAGAEAVVVNLTAMDAQSAGYVTANSCASMVAGPQAQSNLNAVVGSPVANMAIVPVGADGMICVYVSSSMHLAVDVMGTFTRGVAVQFRPVTPVRVHDSRPPA